MNPAERRVEREWKTVQVMIRLACQNLHGGGKTLCAGCEELRSYAERRLEKCPFAEEKPTCVKCPVHCYEAAMRERVRQVMRYAGPRMLLRHPILALRRAETQALCGQLGLTVAHDPSNDDARFRRNRIRHELVPLLDDIAERDVTVLLNRSADLLRSDDQLLDELAAAIEPTDADELARAPGALAARAVRQWLERDGYPPDAATVARVIDVAHGHAAACEVGSGRRIERQGARLILFPTAPTSR